MVPARYSARAGGQDQLVSQLRQHFEFRDPNIVRFSKRGISVLQPHRDTVYYQSRGAMN
jgi:hypothetical protein